jgi:Ca2+/Na+ antiporter
MSSFKWIEVIPWIIAFLGLIFAVYVHFQTKAQQKKANEQLEEAEKEAFKDIQEELNLKKLFKEIKERFAFLTPEPSGSIHETEAELSPLVSRKEMQEHLIGILGSIEKSSGTIEMKRLFNVNSKRVEKYQAQTGSRAYLSFIFAIISMFAGLGFVIWGGSVLLTAKETIALAAGGHFSRKPPREASGPVKHPQKLFIRGTSRRRGG